MFRNTGKCESSRRNSPALLPAATTPTQGAQDPDLAICPASPGPPPSSDTDTFPPKVTGVGAEISEKQPTGAGLLVSAAESHISSTQPTVWEDALQGSLPASRPGAPGTLHAWPSRGLLWTPKRPLKTLWFLQQHSLLKGKEEDRFS